jgi:predicted trehalose synthase
VIAGDLFANKLHIGTNGHFDNEIHLASSQEIALSAEQTNESFILDDSHIIKWQLMLGNTKSREKETLLQDNGFSFTPRSFGYLTHKEKLVASVYEYIKGASDGWAWCIQRAKDNDRGAWIQSLAEITSTMHRAFEGSGFAHGDLHVGQFFMSSTLREALFRQVTRVRLLMLRA